MGMTPNLGLGFVGFVGTFGGLTGLFCRQVGMGGWITLLAAAALGLSAGALHPELLWKLGGDHGSAAEPATDDGTSEGSVER